MPILEERAIDAKTTNDIIKSLEIHRKDFDTTTPKNICLVETPDGKEEIVLVYGDGTKTFIWNKEQKRFLMLDD